MFSRRRQPERRQSAKMLDWERSDEGRRSVQHLTCRRVRCDATALSLLYACQPFRNAATNRPTIHAGHNARGGHDVVVLSCWSLTALFTACDCRVTYGLNFFTVETALINSF